MNPSLKPIADFIGIVLAAAVCEISRRQGVRMHRNRRRYLEARRRLRAEQDADQTRPCYPESTASKEAP